MEAHRPTGTAAVRPSFHRLAWEMSSPIVRVGMILDAAGLAALALSLFCLAAASFVTDEAILGHGLRGCLLALSGGVLLLGLARVLDLVDAFMNGTDPRQAAMQACLDDPPQAAVAPAAPTRDLTAPAPSSAVTVVHPGETGPCAAPPAKVHGLPWRQRRSARAASAHPAAQAEAADVPEIPACEERSFYPHDARRH